MDLFPNEMFVEIFLYLDKATLKSVCGVCKHWHLVVHSLGRLREKLFQLDPREPIRFRRQIIDKGTFRYAYSICGDGKDRVFVADTFAHKLLLFNEGGQLIKQVGSRGPERNEFVFPISICFDRNRNRLLVADQDNMRIQILTPDGVFIDSFPVSYSPCCLCLLPNDDILVGNLYGIDLYGQDGRHKKNIIEIRNTHGVFNMKANRLNQIVISGFTERGITVYNLNGELINTIGKDIIWTQRGIFIDVDDNILVADYGGKYIYIFDSSGKVINQFKTDQSSKTGPFSVYIQNNKIYVLEENFISIYS